MISEIINILHYFCISNLFFLLVLFGWRYRYDKRTRLGALFILCILCYIILSLDPNSVLPFPVRVVLFFGLIALPFFFWMLSSAVFEDHFVPKPWHWSLLFGKELISAIAVFPVFDKINLRGPIESESVLSRVFIPTLLSLGFVIAAIIRTYSGKKDDLVETRRRFREFHILITGTVISFGIFSRLFLRGQELSDILDLINVVLAWILILAFMHLVLELKEGLVNDELNSSEEEKIVHVDPVLRKKIISAFEESKLYRIEGLTIGQLAEEIDVQEYKIRRLINQGMGFRNFPDFLNRYRIQEACEVLLDSEKDDLPIIRIAMDLGYQSLGPFNRAFKELTGVTPTEFRKSRSNGLANPVF
ncbi:AraC family transcriptional regulator [Leptospira perolatii]|uniref:AraC family transcriptional regulator n=1 Tax=Leptospira perolatii TaxID=2023191 RepID=A0A2M9ZN15_9LEPT|nr:helix-turn-helix domain-containing protein [Leptospira perolatii]PJZ68905.1 AraC family transcriptional regulator [Leptospira perolatii]PJZ73476.1 AraC family transcriptional regulator [Leptospira perolatii]